MICERGGCGGNKPEPHPFFVVAMLVGVTAILLLFQFAGQALK